MVVTYSIQDPALVEAVERHRANEGGFRFETSAQLNRVEEERIRLEKERRVGQSICSNRDTSLS